MSPYRKYTAKEPLYISKGSVWRSLRRRFLVYFYGSFKNRKPDKCSQCGKRSHSSRGQIRQYLLNYFDCGHRRYEGIWVTAS